MLCPACDLENIEGADRCENCLTPLRDLDVSRPEAAEGLSRSVLEDHLSLLEPEETISVKPDTPAYDVVQLMKAARSGCALVIETGKLKGIFTEHDVLQRMTGNNAAATSTSVMELMSPNPELLREADCIASALNKMSLGRYRHIPILKSDGSYGVTSIKSVLKYIAGEDW